MDTDDTSSESPTLRCSLCHRILSSEIETRRPLESTRICDNCNFSYREDTVTTQTGFNSSLDPVISDHVNPDDDDGGAGETDVVENTVWRLMDRIQLHRSLATNGRNRPNDWLSEILSDEGVRSNETRRLFDISDGELLETSGYVETRGPRLGAPPAASWFVKNLDRAVVDEPGLVCVICKDNVCAGSVVNRLPCGHVYHPSCIVPWLNARNTCPLCRYEVPSDDRDRSRQERVVHGGLGESGGGRWWFVVAPLVSVMGVMVVFWLGEGLFGGQRDDRSTGWGLF